MDALRQLQLLNKDMLKDVLEFFNQYKIGYYAAYGTLLGAARHKGSIPWDSDIDLWLLPEDFKRIWKYRKMLPKRYNVELVGDTLYNGEMRIVDRGSGIQFSYYNIKEQRSVTSCMSIDLFLLTRASSRFKRKSLESFMKYLKIAKLDEANKAYLYKYFKNSPLKKFYIRSGDIFRNTIGPHNIEKGIYKIIKGKETADKYVDVGAMKKVEYDVDWFGEGTDLPYEDILLRAPKNWDAVLTQYFGDYMTFPPESERLTSLWKDIQIHY